MVGSQFPVHSSQFNAIAIGFRSLLYNTFKVYNNYLEKYRTGYKPNNRTGYKPNNRIGYKPNNRFGYKPDNRTPNNRFGYKPDISLAIELDISLTIDLDIIDLDMSLT